MASFNLATLLCTLLLLALTLASPHAGVIELSQSSFDSHTSSGTPVLLEFYAPWCGHCARFAASYATVADRLASSRVSVARVDGSEHRLLAQRFKVDGFPSFYLIDGTRVSEFVGPRTVDALVRFANSGGKEHARAPTAAIGPFHFYWRGVAAAVGAAERVRGWVEERPENMRVAAVAGVLSVVAVVISFALFVHVITKPVERPHRD